MKKTGRGNYVIKVKGIRRKEGMIERLYICESALEVVSEECRKYKKQDKECTGSLAGTGFSFSWIITYAAPAGTNVVSSFGGVTSDAGYQNRFLAEIRSVHPLCRYQGDYHLHPMYLPGLSHQDKRTCHQMLLDQYNRHLEAILVLLVTYGQKEEFHAFAARLTPDLQAVRVKEIEFQVVPDDDFLVRSTLGLDEGEKLVASAEIVARLADADGEAGKCSGPFIEQPFFHTEGGMRRLQYELESLRERFDAQPECSQIDQETVAIQIRIIKDILILLPPEFPLNPPSLFYAASKGKFRQVSELAPNWNSLSTCADILENALKSINRNGKKNARR